MTILIADSFSEAGRAALQQAGHTVVFEPGLKGGALTSALAEHEPNVLIVRSTKVTAEDLDASPDLELIVRAGAGYDTIDVESASRCGIFIANCPGKNAAAVAELAFGLMLSLDRRIPDNVSEAREGRWNKGAFTKAQGVKGRTLGLIGMGNIGKEMAVRARAFGMHVIAWSRSLTDEAAAEMGICREVNPIDVARESDVISVHVAATPETQGLIGQDFMAAMRPGSLLINTARASVMDEAAVAKAMDEKNIRVATDVPADEPAGKEGEWLHPLVGHPNFYITHHIGASTDQATVAIGDEAVRVVLTYADTGLVENCVNLADQSPATHLLTVRHLDKVGVLASVLDAAREADWNVQEMENLIFAGAEAACARIRFDGRPDAEALRRINEQPDVLNATIIAL